MKIPHMKPSEKTCKSLRRAYWYTVGALALLFYIAYGCEWLTVWSAHLGKEDALPLPGEASQQADE